MKADPPIRKDKRCACGCGRKLLAGPPASMPKMLRENFARELAGDPFATSACCRRHHGCEFKSEDPGDRGAKGGQAAAARFKAEHGGRSPKFTANPTEAFV